MYDNDDGTLAGSLMTLFDTATKAGSQDLRNELMIRTIASTLIAIVVLLD